MEMGSIRRRRPSPSLVIALLALFVSLGGTSYAVSKIGSSQVANNSLRSADLRDNSVQSRDIRNRSLLAKDFKRGQLRAGPKGDTGAPGPQGPQGLQGPPGSSGGALIQGSTGEDLITVASSEERFPPSGYSALEPGGQGGQWNVSPNATTVVRDLVARLESAPGAGTGGRLVQVFNLDTNAAVFGCLVSGTATTCDTGSASTTLPPMTRYAIRIFNGNPTSAASNGAAWSFRLVTP
jgi:hypothetical protein